MDSAPVANASKMIISFWFRDAAQKASSSRGTINPPVSPPAIVQWEQGFWGSGPASNPKTMVPPNGQYSITYDPSFHCCEMFYNPYGLPTGGLIFGDLFLGPAMCWIPCAPPVISNSWDFTGNAIGDPANNAKVAMSKLGVRTLLTFGDPTIPYNYSEWETFTPGVIDAVDYTLPALASAAGIIIPISPPPYKVHPQGGPCKGLFKIQTFKNKKAPISKGNVPQSFIGIADDGVIVINLQTDTKATVKGMAFHQSKITEIWASQSHLEINGPPYTYTQLGFPFPDGHWVIVPGYWNGYQFEYEDISDFIMGCVPESFAITSRFVGLDISTVQKITDGGWHHMLFSFDISGTVDIETPSVPDYTWSKLFPTYHQGTVKVNANECMAWLALDDENITGGNLQNSCGVHDGFRMPKLWGTETTQILDCGPTGAYNRGGSNKDNWILPRNAWLRGWGGNPKDGLLQVASVSPIIDNTALDPGYRCSSNMELGNCFGTSNGDFDVMGWTGAIWPLYGGCPDVAGAPWHGESFPKKPSVPNPPEIFDWPKYHCSGFSIPLSGHPIGVPCTLGEDPTSVGGTGEKNNTGLEMAELQIWIGKSLDTGILQNRRLFIDQKKDQNGNPTGPKLPVNPRVAAKQLGKPDILLHGSSAWVHGRNTGTSGYDESGKIKPSGQFHPTAAIYPFKPEPKLGQ
jgi:hypothetical protein